MDSDLIEALGERARAAKLQPCGLTTMARAVLRQALGLDGPVPAPREEVRPDPAVHAGQPPPAAEHFREPLAAIREPALDPDPPPSRMAVARAALEIAENRSAHLGLGSPPRRPQQGATGRNHRSRDIPAGARCTGCHEPFPSDCIGGGDCRNRWELPAAEGEAPPSAAEPKEYDPW